MQDILHGVVLRLKQYVKGSLKVQRIFEHKLLLSFYVIEVCEEKLVEAHNGQWFMSPGQMEVASAGNFGHHYCCIYHSLVKQLTSS